MSKIYYPSPTLHRHKVPHRLNEKFLRVDPDAMRMLLDYFGYPSSPPAAPKASFVHKPPL